VEEFQLSPGVKIPLTLTVDKTPGTLLHQSVIRFIVGLILITIIFWLTLIILLPYKKRKNWQVFKMK
jgi:hypothetical protein